MRLSESFIPTLREVPAEAEVASHKLMLRAGMIRKLASGIYCYLPLGYRTFRKIERIVREEMDRTGAQELVMPGLLPSDYYRESGRWEQYGPDMFRLKDRSDRDFCLGPTHEEIFTEVVRNEIRSYRALPFTLYQIQTKYRDERRPRFGVLRSREFVMKDAYSFDRDKQGLDISYKKMYDAYCRIFDRCGLKYLSVHADSGAMGGSDSQEFMVLSEIGEDIVAYCKACGYSANEEKAQCIVPQQGMEAAYAAYAADAAGNSGGASVAGVSEGADSSGASGVSVAGVSGGADASSVSGASGVSVAGVSGGADSSGASGVSGVSVAGVSGGADSSGASGVSGASVAGVSEGADSSGASGVSVASVAGVSRAPGDKKIRKVATPSVRTIEELTVFFGCKPDMLAKTLLYKADGRIVAVVLRGDRELNEVKLKNHLGCSELVMAEQREVTDVTGAEAGFAGPIRLKKGIEVIADLEIPYMVNFITGANETGYHLADVNYGRDFKANAVADVRNAVNGDPCPQCGAGLSFATGIEVGHVFKLGTKYSKAMNCVYLDEGGIENPMVMGSYGIGLGRMMAAVIEQNNDENGIIWPMSIAPYQVIVVPVNMSEAVIAETGERIYRQLLEKGIEVMLDDRDERPGVKFKDADLIGIPIRVVIGRKAASGIVELKFRDSSAVSELNISDVLPAILEKIG